MVSLASVAPGNGAQKEIELHNTIQIIGNLGRDPEQREGRANGAAFTVLSVATRRSWKNAEGGWESRTDWHRVVCFQCIGETALALHKGDQVPVGVGGLAGRVGIVGKMTWGIGGDRD